MNTLSVSPGTFVHKAVSVVQPSCKGGQHKPLACRNHQGIPICGVTRRISRVQCTVAAGFTQRDSASSRYSGSSHVKAESVVTRRVVIQKHIALSAGAWLVSGWPSFASEVLPSNLVRYVRRLIRGSVHACNLCTLGSKV